MDDSLDFLNKMGESTGVHVQCSCWEYGERCVRPTVIFSIKDPRIQFCHKHSQDKSWGEGFLANFCRLNGFYPCSVYTDGQMVSCAADSDFMWGVEKGETSGKLSFGCAKHIGELQRCYNWIVSIRFR